MIQIRNRVLSFLILFMLIASTFLATPRPVSAAGAITVTDKRDNGVGCTLREAIQAANTGLPYGGCDVKGLTEIYLEAGEYFLETAGADDTNLSGDLDIMVNLTISGVGVSAYTGTIISAGAGFGDRIFHVKSPSSNKITVKFNNLRVKGGIQSGGYGGAGFLVDNANLTLNRVFVTDNIVPASGTGGGITNLSNSSLAIQQSTFSLNRAGNGGAIYNEGALTIENSLFQGNSGSAAGGAIDNLASVNIDVKITNTTITANSSVSGAGISNSGKITMINTTIMDNVQSAGVVLKYSSRLTMSNSIIARHLQGPNCMRDQTSATFTSQGYNLVDGNNNATNRCEYVGTDKVGADPLLTAQVGVNGGPTETYAFITTTSPAIDAIPPTAGCPTTDQRLYGRWADGNKADANVGWCDIGAYEEGGITHKNLLPSVGR